MNLVTNARQAIRNDLGTVTIGVSPASRRSNRRQGGDFVRVRVADTGCGMDEATQARIFEPFYTTKPSGSGTGLGLSMSYEIVVQQHKGQLRVESEPGQFAEFIISLPKTTA